jgi:hypothetical protein
MPMVSIACLMEGLSTKVYTTGLFLFDDERKSLRDSLKIKLADFIIVATQNTYFLNGKFRYLFLPIYNIDTL